MNHPGAELLGINCKLQMCHTGIFRAMKISGIQVFASFWIPDLGCHKDLPEGGTRPG
jgi:hypothetical protein